MLRAFAAALAPLGDRLLAVLLQLPPSLTAAEGARRLERLLTTRPAGLPVVVEVRHPSWHAPELVELLEREEAGLARVEYALGASPGRVGGGAAGVERATPLRAAARRPR